MQRSTPQWNTYREIKKYKIEQYGNKRKCVRGRASYEEKCELVKMLERVDGAHNTAVGMEQER